MPRSLAPLAGESLSGFLLRMAHHLDEPPGYVAWRSGLLRSERFSTAVVPVRQLVMLEAPAAFAHATRMSTAEAERLTFLPYVDRYPPVALSLMRGREGEPPRPRGAFPAWLLTKSTRYCPLCLKGDGSAIQNLFGGPWKLLWHLPVVFGCLDHKVLLRELCPGCGNPAQNTGTEATRALFPAPAKRAPHPVTCRNSTTDSRDGPLCGHRLDTVAPGDPLSEDLVRLQRRLLDLLEPATEPATAFMAFADLLVMAAVISATWPHTGDAEVAGVLVQALDEHHHLQQAAAASTAPVRPLPGSRHPSLWNTAPRSADATAGLLSLADHHLALPTPGFRWAMAHLLDRTPGTDSPRWGSTWRTLQHDASPLFRHEIQSALHRRFPDQPTPGWADPHGDQTACVVAVRPRGYGPEHIPQEIPKDWLTLISTAPPNSGFKDLPQGRWLRRTVAVQLVQAVTAMSMDEAARFLGMPTHWIGAFPSPLSTFRRRLRRPPYDLPGSMERLIAHILKLPKPMDFRERRETLKSWHLSARQWSKITTASAHQIGKGPRARECASAVIWAKATGSEWRLAPCFQPPLSPHDRKLDRHGYEGTTIGRWSQDHRDHPGLLGFLHLLDDAAENLVNVS